MILGWPKVHSASSIRSYGKTQTIILVNPVIYRLENKYLEDYSQEVLETALSREGKWELSTFCTYYISMYSLSF